jgi:hypothetical protein
MGLNGATAHCFFLLDRLSETKSHIPNGQNSVYRFARRARVVSHELAIVRSEGR